MKIILFAIFSIRMCISEPQLQLLNIVFRHGDRTPAPGQIFSTNSYSESSFYPMGLGSLTNNGKLRVYRLGKFLRKKYKDFLGDVYIPNLLYARSTDFDRTKMSLQLVLAGLFPPCDSQKWNSALNWQPIPYIYFSNLEDDVLGITFQSSFRKEKARVSKTDFIQKLFEQYQSFIFQLENVTSKKIRNSLDIYNIYDTLYCEWKMNLTLPSWSKGMFPDGKLRDAALIDYDVMTYDKNMTYQLGGKLSEKIKGDILAATKTTKANERKLFLYSGHDFNVAGALASLQVFRKPLYIPSFASAAIIELYKDNNKYFVKVLYYDGESSTVKEMEMLGCSILCPLEKYLAIVNELLN